MTLLADTVPESPACDLSEALFVTAGSVIGREHTRLLKNNQDATALRVDPERIIAVVADGCSSGRYSEVGARLAVQWLVSHLPRLMQLYGRDEGFLLGQIEYELLGYLERVLDPLGATRNALVGDLALFTLLIAVVEPETTRVFGVGDGLIAVNRDLRILDSGPDNAPAYLGYRLARPRLLHGPRNNRLRTYLRRETAQVDSLLIGTDGLIDLARAREPIVSEWLRDPKYLRNPLSLHRSLVVLGQVHRRLSDDASCALIRRRA